ncbi:uncharacterized protein LOC132029214 [Mustela nigripes]|uniref:uncharacterized protein LOC132029214 n=1 Tax=Mustela nigripes TaxID=77151 RepID=UPI0028169350|nr:uncharacterized protein LOC132029214 [Mustela nigripes]
MTFTSPRAAAITSVCALTAAAPGGTQPIKLVSGLLPVLQVLPPPSVCVNTLSGGPDVGFGLVPAGDLARQLEGSTTAGPSLRSFTPAQQRGHDHPQFPRQGAGEPDLWWPRSPEGRPSPGPRRAAYRSADAAADHAGHPWALILAKNWTSFSDSAAARLRAPRPTTAELTATQSPGMHPHLAGRPLRTTWDGVRRAPVPERPTSWQGQAKQNREEK